MVDWLVITADCTEAGRGVRGYTLAGFLRTYFGRRAVAMQSPEEWRHAPIKAATAFVGLPSSLTPEELQRLRTDSRQVVPFDYLDQQELAWNIEQETTLRRTSDRYLKPWFERAWRHDLQMGMLPIRRYSRFTAAVVCDRCSRRLGSRPEAIHDVAFLGRPNETRMYVDGQVEMVDQRFHWIRDVKRDAPQLKFWGGLVEVYPDSRERLHATYGQFDDLMHTEKKVGFAAYYRAIRSSRVALAPGGNVPWTYRHYESLYAGAVLATIDYRERDMLIPLPSEGVVHVPDGAPVLPAVHKALELSRRTPRLGEQHFTHLEQYLRFGAYSSRRPALLNRFTAQLAS
ncbi:hypothetical protein [Lacipirellula parvula]|uniref:Glycosyltransferase family 1 protein n=1 Tax=Lacipirellula parvula TaxID=2650471 RepID=A0A5K7X2D4_9BACT|nr:hypothetical protein [Lacipirellula parvula]BBO30640.1 hypothetical protein PLANPX_0252 [Lacipirellula parvula]